MFGQSQSLRRRLACSCTPCSARWGAFFLLELFRGGDAFAGGWGRRSGRHVRRRRCWRVRRRGSQRKCCRVRRSGGRRRRWRVRRLEFTAAAAAAAVGRGGEHTHNTRKGKNVNQNERGCVPHSQHHPRLHLAIALARGHGQASTPWRARCACGGSRFAQSGGFKKAARMCMPERCVGFIFTVAFLGAVRSRVLDFTRRLGSPRDGRGVQRHGCGGEQGGPCSRVPPWRGPGSACLRSTAHPVRVNKLRRCTNMHALFVSSLGKNVRRGRVRT